MISFAVFRDEIHPDNVHKMFTITDDCRNFIHVVERDSITKNLNFAFIIFQVVWKGNLTVQPE